MTPEEQLAPTLRPPCIVAACPRAAAWTPSDATLGDYCQAHIDEWLMAEDRADFADEYARDARSEVA